MRTSCRDQDAVLTRFQPLLNGNVLRNALVATAVLLRHNALQHIDHWERAIIRSRIASRIKNLIVGTFDDRTLIVIDGHGEVARSSFINGIGNLC